MSTLRPLLLLAWAPIVLLVIGRAGISPAPTPPIPSRQVHLDFHTSEHIPDVGSRFNKENWQQALKLGHVNWINIFAKCHHGWSYYPTKIGRQHPTLKIDLMGEQIAACHEIGVRCPLYFTVGWSAWEAEAHPEWRVVKKDGSFAARSVDFNAKPEDRRPETSWIFLCPSGDYLSLILRQTEEICQRYPVDGFFYDIDNVSPPCYCKNCGAGMAAEGVNVEDDDAVAAYNARNWKKFFAAARQVISKHHPNATVFFNGTTKLLPHCTNYEMWADNTQQELEDLPTTWGGYDKFPLRSKFFHNTGRPVFAMSGKFHTSWGEFGGFKHPEAMRYEAAAMIAFGASCNFGDQMHPSGELDLETYRRIGHAYAYVEQIEAYGVGGRPVSRLGLWRTDSMFDDEGVSNMLMELHQDYAVVERDQDLAKYDVIVMTGSAGLTEARAARLGEFVKQGGGLLVLGKSALGKDQQSFLLDVGATYLGPANYDLDYLVVGDKFRQADPPTDRGSAGGRGSAFRAPRSALVASPILTYQAAIRVQPREDAEVLATIREPYFDRTYASYCSHQNTPYRLEPASHPGALRKGRVVFLPHSLGYLYYTNGAQLHRQFFANALRLIYDRPMVSTALPTAGRVSLLHQPQQRRYVAHLLYGPPIQRGRAQVIEDLPTLDNVPVEVRLPEKVRDVYLVPGKRKLKPTRRDDVVRVVVPSFNCHVAVVFEY
jgi:hypothetical protein